MEKEEFSNEDFKYIRTGYISGDRQADAIVTAMTDLLPGDGVMPSRWRWDCQDSFLAKYSDLGVLLWAKAASYHMLILSGTHLFRIWTDSANTCVLDLNDSLALSIAQKGFEVEDIPESCDRKCKPFQKRTRLSTVDEAVDFMDLVSKTYGLKEWRAD